jgi:hypothetical protein
MGQYNAWQNIEFLCIILDGTRIYHSHVLKWNKKSAYQTGSVTPDDNTLAAFNFVMLPVAVNGVLINLFLISIL